MAMITENKTWNADNGDGTYTNPILYTDYSDPDVCRVGEDYFMTASSFCNAPGLPVLHSKDLVNWKVISYAVDKVPGEQYRAPLHGCGVWAPAIRYHEGTFIIFFPMPDEGIYVVKTKDPWGKWEEPTCLFSGKGWIDPCPFWDDDGRAYMVSGFAKSRIGFKSVLNLCEITPDCLHMMDEGKHIFDGNVNGQETIEGPKLYKRNGYYYIFAPAGGVKQGWQTVLRSREIWGPYEYRNVLLQKDTEVNGPHQGAWVDTPTGEDWFVHFQDVYAAGRIVHLQPMRWVDDWPVIGEISQEELAAGEVAGKPVRTYRKPDVGGVYDRVSPAASDAFCGEPLGLQWQWNANSDKDWYMLGAGGLALRAVERTADSLSNVPNLLLQKWCMPEFCAETKLLLSDMQCGDTAGMVSMGVTFGAVAVEKRSDAFVIKTIGGEQKFDKERASATDTETVIREIPLDTQTIYFRNQVERVPSTKFNSDGPYTFPIPAEEIRFSYSLDGESYEEASVYPAKAGRWVGVKNGLFAYHENAGTAGQARFEYFRFV
ncbi:MAG: glycoside hydrolase 43 family protein [Roseburia sp.]|nr:glycoside hydrolase 43 family protein [Roseburia sp.]